MADVSSEKSLLSVLTLDAEEKKSSTPRGAMLAAEPLPTVDQRADMYLRAVYGPGRAGTVEEHATARARILDAMAAGIAGHAIAKTLDRRKDREGAYDRQPAAPASIPLSSFARSIGALSALAAHIVQTALKSAALLLSFDEATRTFRLAAGAAALFVLGAGWSTVWLHALRTVEKNVAAWTGWEAQAGNTYSCAERSVGGFPFRVEVRCRNPQAKVLADETRLVLEAAEFRAVGQLFQNDLVTAEVKGPISITHSGYSVVADWTLARASIHGGASRVDKVSISLEDFKFNQVTDSGNEMMVNGHRATFDIDFNRTSDPSRRDIDLALYINRAYLPLGSQPFNAEIAAMLRGAADAKPQPWLARLKEWESTDGKLAVKHARIRHQGDVAVAQGTVGLDGSGRIAGRLRVTATAINFERLAEAFLGDNARAKAAQALVRAGDVDPRFVEEKRRQLAQTEQEGRELRSLGVPPLPAPNAAKGEVTVPLTFMHGAIFLGSVPVSQIPPLY